MGVLLIDGEYYRKLYSIERLQEIIEKFIGVINYPKSIVYYSANINAIKETLNAIKNLEINDKGYITPQNSGKRVQKGVDGYIVKDLILLSQDSSVNDIYLIAGDGDLIAGIEYAKENGKNIRVISCIENTAKKIEDLVEVFNFQDYIEDVAPERSCNEILLLDNTSKLKNMWLEKKDDEEWLSSSAIGQERKKYHFKYTEGKLQALLNQFEKDGIIEQQKELAGPGKKIRFLNVS